MDIMWQVLLGIVATGTFLATARITVVGLGHIPKSAALRFVTNDRWCLSLIAFIPMFAGSFARREVSPLPWSAFSTAAARHGTADGVISFLIVVTVDLWLLWIPAHSYVRNKPGLDRRTVVLARLLNLVVGLLILTPQNPIYWFLERIPARDPDDY